MNGNGTGKPIDASRAPYTQYGIGIKRGNPKRCFSCGEPIKHGDSWRMDGSEADPKLGRYITIQHVPKCPDAKAQRKFQAMMKRAA